MPSGSEPDTAFQGTPWNAKQISRYTFQVFERKWFENLAENLPLIRTEGDVKDLERLDGKPAVVIGAGPSVRKYRHLEALREVQGNVVIFATDRMLRECFKAGLLPDFAVTSDGSDSIKDFYDGLWIEDLKVALSVFTSPKAVSVMEGKRFWFIPPVDSPFEEKSLTRAVYWMTGGKTILVSLGNVGGMAWNLAYFLGCNPIFLVGLDYGYGEDTRIEDTIYYEAYVNLCKGNVEEARKCFKWVTNPLGRRVLVDLNWDVYRFIFTQFADRASVETFNLSPESSLFSRKVRYMDMSEFLEKYGRRSGDG